MQAAANYINTCHFPEALNVLSSISQRTAEWYYLSAVANAASAIIMQPPRAKTAASMDPSNPAYRNLVQQLSYGTYRYDSMSENYGGQRGAWEAAVPILSASAFSVRVSTLFGCC